MRGWEETREGLEAKAGEGEREREGARQICLEAS